MTAWHRAMARPGPPVGGVVEIVLDVQLGTDPDGSGYARVLVQGVFSQGHRPDIPLRPGAQRNVVSCFYGQPMGSVSAFKIALGEEPTVGP